MLSAEAIPYCQFLGRDPGRAVLREGCTVLLRFLSASYTSASAKVRMPALLNSLSSCRVSFIHPFGPLFIHSVVASFLQAISYSCILSFIDHFAQSLDCSLFVHVCSIFYQHKKHSLEFDSFLLYVQSYIFSLMLVFCFHSVHKHCHFTRSSLGASM